MKDYAILLPGQGSQYVGMGKKLYDKYDVVKELYDKANSILEYNIRDLCFNGDISELTNTRNAQPAILLAGFAAYKVFCEKVGYEPKFIVGHSIGEITALTCAGAIDFEDALKIVYHRGTLMENANPNIKGAMCAVLDCKISNIEKICRELSVGDDYVEIANYNEYNQVVISGKKTTINMAIDRLNDLGSKCIMLNVSGAFHSKLMQPIVENFYNTLKTFQFNDFNIPVISNVNALPYTDKNLICDNLVKQIVSPVQWIKIMEFLKGKMLDCVVDLGPSNVVCNLTKKCNLEIDIFSLEKEEEKTFNYFKEITYKTCKEIFEFEHTVVTKCIAITVCTKNENTDINEYELGVLKPYRRMKEIGLLIEQENRKPSDEESIEALNLLNKIFETKRTSIDEQKVRAKEICRVVDVKKHIKEETFLGKFLVE